MSVLNILGNFVIVLRLAPEKESSETTDFVLLSLLHINSTLCKRKGKGCHDNNELTYDVRTAM